MGHVCAYQWTVIGLIAWEGLGREIADKTYDLMANKVAKHGISDHRRCETNTPKTCGCQGLNGEVEGISCSYGCAWSYYHDGCKFAQGGMNDVVNKFKMQRSTPKPVRQEIDKSINNLATLMAPLHKKLAPKGYATMVKEEEQSHKCRIGNAPGKPYSGVTIG